MLTHVPALPPPTPTPTFSFKAKLAHLKINLIILLLGHKCSRIHLQFTIEYTHTNSISRNACGMLMLMLNPPVPFFSPRLSMPMCKSTILHVVLVIHIRIQIHWIARHVRRKLCSCCFASPPTPLPACFSPRPSMLICKSTILHPLFRPRPNMRICN